MKLRFPLLLTALLWGLLSASAQPAPKKTTPRAGHFTFGPRTTIAADSELLPLARYAAEYLGCEVCNGVAGDGAVVLTLDAADGEASEGYVLDITPDHIRIGGSAYGGVFNGLQQLFRAPAARGLCPEGRCRGNAGRLHGDRGCTAFRLPRNDARRGENMDR